MGYWIDLCYIIDVYTDREETEGEGLPEETKGSQLYCNHPEEH